MVIGTRDWDTVKRFLRDLETGETVRPGAIRRQHVCIVLQDGERWYLNLLVSETSRRSRITSEAAANLDRGNKLDGCMHLRDVYGRDVPISVDVVNITKELVAGKTLAPGEIRPHMVLTPEYERRIQGMSSPGGRGSPTFSKGGPAKEQRRTRSLGRSGVEKQGSRCLSSISR